MTAGRRWLKNLQPTDVGSLAGRGMLNRSPRASAQRIRSICIAVNLLFFLDFFNYFSKFVDFSCLLLYVILSWIFQGWFAEKKENALMTIDIFNYETKLFERTNTNFEKSCGIQWLLKVFLLLVSMLISPLGAFCQVSYSIFTVLNFRDHVKVLPNNMKLNTLG